MKLVTRIQREDLKEAVAAVAGQIGAELISVAADGEEGERQLMDALRSHPTLAFLEVGISPDLERWRIETRARGAALVVACADEAETLQAAGAMVDEWVLTSASSEELISRFQSAIRRRESTNDPVAASRIAEHLRYEELLYDRFTGFPTLPVMVERGREMLDRVGRVTILYIEFVRYSKLEEIYGWQKLDEVLQTTANAVRVFYDLQRGEHESLLMVSHTGDDDFIFFTELRDPPETTEMRINEIAEELENHIRSRLEQDHGEDIAGLFSIYIGATTIYRNPKIRTERMIYRGIREASQAARSVEHRERSRKVADLKTLVRDGAVMIEYHPIVVTETAEIYGYEALARGGQRGLRSPEIMFSVAEEANMIWELSRLCRRRAIEGIQANLEPHQFLFLNIDPHDFRDPTFRYLDVDELGIENPDRIVLEITERTAITDYPVFQEYISSFRKQGFRFAVDDAGSGYAGLGSIANLEPDFIKLDISLISGIDTNFMKQNLVETMVSFANDHGIKVIAEGVERAEEWETVKALGAHYTQGFLFHKPRFTGKEQVDQAVE